MAKCNQLRFLPFKELIVPLVRVRSAAAAAAAARMRTVNY